MALFNKILIANRGEIALRIIRTCHLMGINTVAVYSEADVDAPFVKEAKEAVCVGEAQAKKSYLNIDKIISTAKELNVDAIHPGYGFLSESSIFVELCEDAGITFIGPGKDVMEIMGSKLKSRQMMKAAGIPVVPGSDKNLDSLEDALEVAGELEFPLMLKASAGGGGIGMKKVHDKEELTAAFKTTKKQAENFFSDDKLFLEQWIYEPRHIEVQIAADSKGNVIHLFERECSVQRRHQKVIEESPSPFLSDEVRKKLLEAAVKGVEHLGYKNLGTMEFIFDQSGDFYFLEMNTRLQVEHPVTEEITGLDLVEWQIRIAAGETLPLTQEEVVQSGHAIEARLYAEDPKTYFPSPGTITKLRLAEDLGRYDFGVVEGSKVTPFYDAMIGKIIIHGEGREEAIDKMKKALEKLEVEGIITNLPLLKDIMTADQFTSGQYTTNFLDEFNK
ncbi:acetyl-CoA carboxylase biotin carboxylase subunit [Lacicoccus alkaliphilus]|uniref:biotin carboxylase n=1 Tax=Lacicoccus alkaliphilus DSM 16010 TaxID=1123231 RepID=A0A1M7H3I1_9BACL|nr:acetyl-CoA carboxylase biotin carboxylase subunit [Salinicoccus alkaliphilus]SHM23234.1 acetyl-CoA carboxylase, biotin carboxylase subunit [Salinicoccus alkaliphilus DSM 16010]